MSSLVILAASVFEISCGKRDRQTNKQTVVNSTPAAAVHVVSDLHWKAEISILTDLTLCT